MSDTYETTDLLNQYLLFHFGTAEQQLAFPEGMHAALNFPQRCAQAALSAHGARPKRRALDLGCAVGGATFELSRTFDQSIGIDFSGSFASAAQKIGREGRHTCLRHEEGKQFTELEVALPEGVSPETTHFAQGDAQALPADLGVFDLVLACNLICRLNQPELLLDRLPALLNQGGTLLITTPLTWMDAYTPEARWLSQPGQSGFEGLSKALSGHFDLISVEDMPFIIREHRRKYQYSFAQASIWRRTSG